MDIFNYVTQTKQLSFQVNNEIFSAALLCGGRMLVCGDKEHLYFNDVETGKQVCFYFLQEHETKWLSVDRCLSRYS